MRLFSRLNIFLFYWLLTSLQHIDATCLSSIKEDLVFVLDSSNSIYWYEWEEMLNFVSTLVETAIPTGTRVGEVVFGTYVSTVFGLNQYTDLDDIAYAVTHYTRKLGGWTYTKDALKHAYKDVFEASWIEDRAKKLVLITDGMPTDNPCSYSSTLKAAGIDVLIVAVGDWIYSSNMKCLVNDVDKNIIQLGSFDDMMKAIDAVQKVICANDFHLNVIEVQPYTESSGHLSSTTSSPRFIEIYNLGGEMDFYGIQLSGMYTGEITTSTIMEQGYILLISEDASLASDCATSCVFHHWTGSIDDYEEQDEDGTINQGYNITVSYKNVTIQWARWIKDDGFPQVARGRSFELTLPASNNEIGSNWRSSCDMGGSPGKPPATECSGCNDDADCRFQGDTTAYCDEANHVCICSDRGYYPLGRTCDPLPTPTDCMVEGLSGVDGRYIIDWIQPAFIDSLAFMRIEVTFTLSGSYTQSILEERNAPPTADFAIDEDYLHNVTIAAVFNRSDVSYWTVEVGCGVQAAPTVVPSRSPTKTPTRVPTKVPTLSTVPTVDSCQLRITSNADTGALMSWVYSGGYVVDGNATDPIAFVVRWGEFVASYFSYATGKSSTANVTLVAGWNYTDVVGAVTVEGYEDNGPVLSDPVGCTVVQATAPPVAYPVPAPDSCELDIDAGGKLGIVTIVPPSTPYIVGNVTKTLGYLVRVESTSYTDYNLGYDGTLTQKIVIPSSAYTVYGVSLGSEDDIHPESDEVVCNIVTLSPTYAPTPAETKWEIPPLSSCEVLVNRGQMNNEVVVTISWVKGSQYEHDGVDWPLKGYKYKLGGTSDWIEVSNENTTTINDVWKISYADAALTTYMVAVGQEMINEVQEYPDSSKIPCDLNTMDPTNSPTKSPSLSPTYSPTKIPTGAPTFETPMAGFLQTDPLTGQTLYNCMKGAEEIEVQIFLNPAALLPVPMKWEILNSTGQPVTGKFNETSGIVSFGKYMVNYRTESPGCSETGGSCIEEYDCMPHNGYDYCVKEMGEVYEKIYISAKDDGHRHGDPERYSVVFSPPNDYVNNEYYYNASEYSIDSDHNNATIVLYDAGSPEFCKASPESAACTMTRHFVMRPWYWIIIVILALCLIFAIYYARYKATAASRANRAKNIAEEMLKETLLEAEVGVGAGTTSRINPLALGGGNHVVNENVGPSAVDDDEEGNVVGEGFGSGKNQFVPTL